MRPERKPLLSIFPIKLKAMQRQRCPIAETLACIVNILQKMKQILFIVFLVLNACTQNTSTKTFISPREWFKFEQPIDWTFEDEGEGTYLFYNKEHWKGSFRITPLRIGGDDTISIKQKIQEHLNEELEKNEGATKVLVGDREMIHYSKKIQQDNHDLQISYWIFGLKTTLFTCSFTIDFGTDINQKIMKEMDLCNRALASIELYNNE